ncbi:hypothetical protein ABT063_27675 [Streptomyces sp. NPDC002838]|uniref:hypothetical protein n=1 Tax=Streptomyces sp. NPDC002838 TaxID=3154436 RepID=UPI0033218F77
MLDLTLVQVVASALATVVGAVLASLPGVTGTIIGAAVISTSATTGAAVFSHAFRRTGEGIRSRVPPIGVPRTPGQERAEHRADARAAFGLPADATAVDALPNIARTDQHMDLARQETASLAAEIADDTAPFPIRQRLQQRQTTLLAIISQHEANRVHPTSTP